MVDRCNCFCSSRVYSSWTYFHLVCYFSSCYNVFLNCNREYSLSRIFFRNSFNSFAIFNKKYCKKIRSQKNDKVDRITGTVVEIKDIDEKGNYVIYLDGKHWLGKSEAPLNIGDKAKILKIEGIKLVLEKEN